jgi:hypothetical protein
LDIDINSFNIINLFLISGDFMVKIGFEDIVFWIFILIIIGTALWLLSGSPPESTALITIALAFAGSELLIWKRIFSIEKRTAISFIKLKNNIDKNNLIINNRFDQLEEKLSINNKLIKRKK